jgi:transcriptional regulator with XRE-family HTH domain
MNDRPVSDADVRRIEKEIDLITDVQYLIQEVMNERGLSRAEVADMLGISKPRMTQLLGDNSNPTLRTLVGVFDVMGEQIRITRVREDAQAVCEPEVAADWQQGAVIEAEEVRADSKSARHKTGFIKDLIDRSDNGWIVAGEPVSNDNWDYFQSDELAFG